MERDTEKLLKELREALKSDGLMVSDEEAGRILVELRNLAQIALQITQTKYAESK